MTKNAVHLLLDSGAFSAWNRGENIDLHAYISYIKQNQHLIDGYVTLDVIPGLFGRKRTQKEVDDSASASYANHQIMKAEGLKPIPVFHQGERWVWLEKYLSDREECIGVSTYKDLPASEHQYWLDQVFSILTDREGYPLVKIHGFGVTSVPLMVRYPWYSVDSTTWSLTPGYGIILVPPYISSQPDYTRRPTRVIMSGVEQKSASSHKRQFENLDPDERDCVEDFLRQVGVSLTQARYDDNARRRAVLFYFSQFAVHRSCEQFRFRKSHFGDEPNNAERQGSPAGQFSIYQAAVSNNRMFNTILTGEEVWDRLLSYFELRDLPEDYLAHYVAHGEGPPSGAKRQPKRRDPVDQLKHDWKDSTYLKRRYLAVEERAEKMGYDDET